MYKLVVKVSSPDIIGDLNRAFAKMGITTDIHYSWRLNFNKVHNNITRQYYFDNNSTEVREIWIFESNEALEDFYSFMTSDNSTKNSNRPYTFGELVQAFQDCGIVLTDTVTNPDGTEVVRFSSAQ